MSRLRRSVQKLNSLSENEYLEPNEQDDLIELLNNVSYSENRQLVKWFLITFLSITPIYVVLPFFKKRHPILSLCCILTIGLNCINLYWFNAYRLKLDDLVLKEEGDAFIDLRDTSKPKP